MTEEEDGIVEDEMKIFYCSRTHSQISQFVNELRRVKLPPSVPPDIAPDAVGPDSKPAKNTDQDETGIEELKHLTLGSRKNLCINATVAKPGAGASATSITERCLELQQPSTPKDKKCRFMPSKDNEVLMNDFRDHALAKIRDIEDFGKLGKKIGICPYYATRAAIKPAEVSAPVESQGGDVHTDGESALDSDTPLPPPPPKIRPRSPVHLTERPHSHHRRSAQPHGRHRKHPVRLHHTDSITACACPIGRVPLEVQESTEGQESSLRDAAGQSH